jgi:hypothetical protein
MQSKKKEYKIQTSRGHGKACRGMKKTATIQVIEPHPSGYFVKKQFRFTVRDPYSKKKAIEKAEDWIKNEL